MTMHKGRGRGPERGALAVEAVGLALALGAAAFLWALLPDAQALDALACLRFYPAPGACNAP
jgi:hypothetical protein